MQINAHHVQQGKSAPQPLNLHAQVRGLQSVKWHALHALMVGSVTLSARQNSTTSKRRTAGMGYTRLVVNAPYVQRENPVQIPLQRNAKRESSAQLEKFIAMSVRSVITTLQRRWKIVYRRLMGRA
jgi:hypothetical protein